MSDDEPGEREDPSAPPAPGFAPPGGYDAPGGSPPQPPPPPPEQPPAPGWWKASDGGWYPPQQAPAAPPPAPPGPSAGPPPGGQWAPPPIGHGAGHPGTAPDGSMYYSPGAGAPSSRGLTGWSLGLGIASVVLFWTCGLGVLLGILAVIFGVMGRSRARERGSSDTGRAQAGLVLGVLGIVGGIAFLAWVATSVWPDVRDEIETELDDGVCEPDIEVFDPDC